MTIHMTTHSLFIEAFTQSLYDWNVLALTNKVPTSHYCIHSNNEIKQCTASVNFPPFQNLVNVFVSCYVAFKTFPDSF